MAEGLVFPVPLAAALTGLDTKSANKAIDSGIVLARAGRSNRRLLSVADLVCLQIEADLAPLVSAKVRRGIIRNIADNPRGEHGLAGGLVFLRIDRARSRLASRLRDLRRARARVRRDRSIMGGAPVIDGTRIPVHQIAGMVEAGASSAEILDGYPGLTSRDIEDALLYAKSYPLRGRPRRQDRTPISRISRTVLPA